jgi:hypothetical protein
MKKTTLLLFLLLCARFGHAFPPSSGCHSPGSKICADRLFASLRTQKWVYLYLFHDFENVIILNLVDELAKCPRMVSVASLFPENHQNYDQWTLQLPRHRILY